MKNYSIILLVLAVLASCSVVRQNKAGEDFKGSQWTLISIDQQDLDGEALGRFQPTLQFDTAGTRISGNAGCNRYNGSVELSADSMRVGPLMSTKMACDQLELEQKFMSHLSEQSLTYQFKDGILTLNSEKGELRFERVEG